MKHCLVAFDTDHIKQYVFATDTLKEIRGASALLDNLNQKKMKGIILSCDLREEDIQTVYAKGGSAMFVVPAEKANRVLTAMQRAYRETTITGSVTGVSEPLPDHWQGLSTPIPEELRRASYKLQRAKAEAPLHCACVAHGLLKECQSCEEHYAEIEVPDAEQETILLCKSCWTKRQYFAKHVKPEKPNRPQDINVLGELSKPRNYVGLIYADGNNMGTFLDALDSLEEVQQFSDVIDEAIEKAVQEAIEMYYQPEARTKTDPYEILLQGGDDLVMLTTAQTAIDVALTVAESFHRRTAGIRELLETKIAADRVERMFQHEPSLAVSVILAHANFPLSVSLSLAESSLKFAKTGYAKRLVEASETDHQGMLNFMTVYNANALDFETFYQQDLRDDITRTDDVIYRTLRPYTVQEMKQLQQDVRQHLHRVPKRKLHQLRDAIFQEKDQAMLAALAAMIRATDQEKRHLQAILRHFAGKCEVFFPWYKVPRNAKQAYYYTSLLDAIELYDFL